MALSANDILKVVVSLAFPDSVVAQNIFWTLFENTGGSADEEDVLDDIETWIEAIYDEIAAVMGADVTIDDAKVYVYDAGDDDFDEVGDRSLTVPFLQNDDFQPHGIAAVSNANTTNPDVQGRKYWGGFTEPSNLDGYLSGGIIAAMSLCVGVWIDPFVGVETGSDFVPGVYSLTKSTFYPFNLDASTNLLWGYQRRRKPGVGT